MAPQDLRAAAEQALAAADVQSPADADWPRLIHLARGSVRRLLALATTDGLELAQRVFSIFELLPKVDWAAAHAFGEELSNAANEQRFETFFDLLLDMRARGLPARQPAREILRRLPSRGD